MAVPAFVALLATPAVMLAFTLGALTAILLNGGVKSRLNNTPPLVRPAVSVRCQRRRHPQPH